MMREQSQVSLFHQEGWSSGSCPFKIRKLKLGSSHLLIDEEVSINWPSDFALSLSRSLAMSARSFEAHYQGNVEHAWTIVTHITPDFRFCSMFKVGLGM